MPSEAVILRPSGEVSELWNPSRCSVQPTHSSRAMIAIKVPPLGESIVEATVSRWLKKEGEAVAVGDTLVELETDKITVEVPAMNAGVLAKIAHARRRRREGRRPAGARSTRAATRCSGAGAAPAAAAAPPRLRPPAARRRTGRALPKPAAPRGAVRPSVRASPAAQRVAAEQRRRSRDRAGHGTRRRGQQARRHRAARAARSAPTEQPPRRHVARRAQPHRAPTPAAPRNGGRETREKMTTRRKRIAEHLLESQHATAHLTTFNEIDMSAVIARARAAQGARREGARREALLHALLREGGVHGAQGVSGRQRADRRRRDRLQALCEHGHRGRVGRRARRAERQGRRSQRDARHLARHRRASQSARATES